MGLTKLNFNEIENASETSNIININKTVTLNQQVILPTKTPTVNQSDGTIWVDQASNNLKIKINSVTYDLSPQTDYNNINVTSPSVISLNGDTGIVNNLTISGTGTVLEIRSSAIGGIQWSNLEILGDLTISGGATLKSTRVPIIVRGNILGTGTITSPDGVNGGAGGVGGPGGAGGIASTVSPEGVITFAQLNGIDSPSTWQNQNGGSSLSMPIEYGVSSGAGGAGGRGTAGGGSGGLARLDNNGYLFNFGAIVNPSISNGGNSGNGFSGGNTFYTYVFPWSNSYFPAVHYGGGGGGAGGAGQPSTYSLASISPRLSGGPGITANSGNNGGSATYLSMPYIGISTPSNSSPGQSGIFGGTGGVGGRVISTWYDSFPGADIINFYGEDNLHVAYSFGSPGSPGGTGGAGGAGGGTGGAHLSIYAGGTISSSICIKPGKGGLTGGSTSFSRAQTGSLWLFTINNTSPITTDLTGGTGTPTGPAGTSNRFSISNSTEITNFFSGILYEPNGLTPAKTKRAISIT